jgi:long-subunit acyl-CoA synthetase (AMP-forming)
MLVAHVSEESVIRTSWDALGEWAGKTPDALFLTQPFEGRLITWTRKKAFDDVCRLASGFRELGLQRGDKVAIFSKNCAEWVLTDVALAMAGLVSVPIYPTAAADTIRYVMQHSEAKAIVIGKLDHPEVADEALETGVKRIGMRYPSAATETSLEDMIDNSTPIEDVQRPSSDDVMTILYTSGSTGTPKGVVLSYGAYEYAVQVASDMLQFGPSDRVLSYLPLAHITERTLIAGPAIFGGFPLYFADTLESFVDDLRRARPTAFISVPRLWVQFQSGVHKSIPPDKLSRLLSIPVVRTLVARKIRRKLGLDACRLVGCGTAPISTDTLRWYLRIGVKISEGWGMSETAGLSCTNTPYRSDRIGTIGAPVPGTEMRISDDGEILIKSPGLFSGYYKQPELTRESFTEDDYFRTGDRGEWLEDLNAFRITGRLKEQFKSAKGKYVSPASIEGKLGGNPIIDQVCVMGAGLRAPVAVVVLSESVSQWPQEKLRRDLERTIESVNDTLESHEKLSHMLVSTDAWTTDNGLLTPTLKIKRDEIEKKFEELVARPTDEAVTWIN